MFVEHMKAKSDGNFMYLHYVLPEIEKGAYKDLELESLPKGLQNYYEDHWIRMGMMKDPIPKEKLKIIYVLSEAGTALTIELLSKFSKEDSVTVQGVLDKWTQFLHMENTEKGMYHSFYHNSFRDFLLNKRIIQAAGIDLRQINEGISDNFFDD